MVFGKKYAWLQMVMWLGMGLNYEHLTYNKKWYSKYWKYTVCVLVVLDTAHYLDLGT